MSQTFRITGFAVVAFLLCSCLVSAGLGAENVSEKKAANRAQVRAMAKNAKVQTLEMQAAEGSVEVDLFQAIEKDQLAAGIIQSGMKGGKLYLENKTDQPLSVRIPQAFGTRPILAQFGGGGGGSGSDDIEQLFGSNAGGGMGGGMGGVMNIPPEKVVAVKYQSVCLEYGKPVPDASSAYELAPLNEVTTKEDVKILCENLHRVDLRAAQFAAWHMNSGTPVAHLASETILRPNGKRVPNFNAKEVQQGMMLIQMARQAAAEAAKKPEESLSSAH